MRDVPEWLEDFTENLEDERVLASRGTPASTSRESDSEPKKSSIEEAQFFHSLPERPKLRSVQENQEYKGSMQDTHW